MTWRVPADAVHYRMPDGMWHDSPGARDGQTIVLGCDHCCQTYGPFLSIRAARNFARAHAAQWHGEIVAAALDREASRYDR